MTHFAREDTAADRQAALDAKSDALWGEHPELVIKEAGGAEYLLKSHMMAMNSGWLNHTLEAACERLATKGDL